jgi:S-adenosylmethionine hydrolase
VVRTENHFFVGPDNGVFWPVIQDHKQSEIIHVTENRYFLSDISHTFHGRDVFAPVAAHISRGIDPLVMGQAVSDPLSIELPVAEQRGDRLYGRAMRVDHFGNLITNIRKRDLEEFLGPKKPIIMLGKMAIEGLRKTYSEAGAGEILALIGSSGCLEIAVNQGRASDIAGTDPDTIIGLSIEVKRV